MTVLVIVPVNASSYKMENMDPYTIYRIEPHEYTIDPGQYQYQYQPQYQYAGDDRQYDVVDSLGYNDNTDYESRYGVNDSSVRSNDYTNGNIAAKTMIVFAQLFSFLGMKPVNATYSAGYVGSMIGNGSLIAIALGVIVIIVAVYFVTKKNNKTTKSKKTVQSKKTERKKSVKKSKARVKK